MRGMSLRAAPFLAAFLTMLLPGAKALALPPLYRGALPAAYGYQAGTYNAIAYQNARRLAIYQQALRQAAYQQSYLANIGRPLLYQQALRQQYLYRQFYLLPRLNGAVSPFPTVGGTGDSGNGTGD
jgi:hypothetical protein